MLKGGKIVQNLNGDPHEQLKWPNEAYWPGKIWDQQLAEGDPPRQILAIEPAAGAKANKKFEADFLEMFAGCAVLTGACSTVGLKVASALDILYQSYGRAWDFSRPKDQADAA